MMLLADEVIRQEKIIQKQKEEITRLKKLNQKPEFREPKLSEEESGKRRKKINAKKKREVKKQKKKLDVPKPVKAKTVVIDCEPENLPADAKFHDYYDYKVKEIEISLVDVIYRVKRYKHNGKLISGSAPVEGKFGNQLKSLVISLCNMLNGSQPRIREILNSFGVSISAGSINSILNNNNEVFKPEVEELLSVGVKNSEFIQTDDTGAFHKGKNYVCTVVGNEYFAYFRTTKHKNRIEFLKTLGVGKLLFLLNAEAMAYARVRGVGEEKLERLSGRSFIEEEEFERYLGNCGISSDDDLRKLKEGALMSSLKERCGKELIIVSDEAGQFNIFHRALCWIHAERHFRKLVSADERAHREVEDYRDKIWKYYLLLKRYKENPSEQRAERLRKLFDTQFDINAKDKELAETVDRFVAKKEALLLVLKYPFIPLHNNRSENYARDFVMRRKIAPTTRSEDGREARDNFLSLKKTCAKLGINFFAYIYDRISGENLIPPLPVLLKQRLTEAVP